MTIAYQGAPGAFGHEACLAFAPEHEPVAVATFAEVAAQVATGKADRGMLPLRNSGAGEVAGVEALVAAHGLVVAAEHVLPVRLHLLGLPGARLEKLAAVASHPMALKQCAGSLARLGLAQEPALNTAMAARSLADPRAAVLASEAAAALYGLEILLRDLQDDPGNATTFILVRRR